MIPVLNLKKQLKHEPKGKDRPGLQPGAWLDLSSDNIFPRWALASLDVRQGGGEEPVGFQVRHFR